MAYRVDDTKERVTLELEGENSVQQVAELHRELLAAGASTKSVSVKARLSGTVDFTVVQLLVALQSCCPGLCIEQASEDFLASLDRCGMRRHLRTALRSENLDAAVSGHEAVR